MKRLFIFLLMAWTFEASAQQPSEVWSPDNGDGTYQNPVLYADYSDPDVCAVGEDYYLTASSFGCVPGLPILHSRDLVNWNLVGHALQELEPHEVFDKPAHGQGVWAPSIRHHADSLYIYWGDPDRGIFMVKTHDPAGPWEKPICVIQGRGMIDPCPLWDTNGRCYLVHGWANSRAGFNSVLSVRELTADGKHAIEQPRIVFDGGQVNHTTEGPKFYVRNGYYWILCPAGGVEGGWQLAMRSRSVYGPYEWRRVMWQGSTTINGPHQGGWVHTAFGEDWFLHFNDRNAYGRVVYLQPVDWSSGWPIMGQQGEPYTQFRKPKSSSTVIVNPQENDEFNGPLGPQWQWHANYNQMWGMPTAEGNYRLYTQELENTLWQAPNLLLQKISAPRYTATARIRFTAKEDKQWAALLMMGMDYSALAICREKDHFLVQQRTCKDADQQGKEHVQTLDTLPATERDTIDYAPAIHLDIFLRLQVADGQCRFAYSTDGRSYHQAGTPFTMRKGKWIGAKMGFVASTPHLTKSRGWLDIDWFHVSK